MYLFLTQICSFSVIDAFAKIYTHSAPKSPGNSVFRFSESSVKFCLQLGASRLFSFTNLKKLQVFCQFLDKKHLQYVKKSLMSQFRQKRLSLVCCDHCYISFKSDNDMIEHWSNIHNSQVFACKSCDYKTC
jgi:hypothetical protein